MAETTAPLDVTYLPNPKVLQRRKATKPQFARPPQRDQKQHGAMLRQGTTALKTKIQSLTPEQKRAVYLKICTANPVQEADLKKAGMYPIRQVGKHLLVALTLDPTLAAMEARIGEYERSKKPFPDNSMLLANLIAGPETLTPAERMSDTFAAEQSRLFAAAHAIVKLQLAPLLPKNPTPEGFRASLNEGFNKLKSALLTQGAVYEYRYSRDELTLTVCARVKGSLLKQMLQQPEWSFIIWFDTLPRFQTVHELVDNFDVTGKTINPPPPTAPLVCVIDTGVLVTNALIRPAITPQHSKSFVKGSENNPSDEHNHGTGVAGIALYHDLGGKLKEVTFTPAVRLANARILNAKNELAPGEMLSTVIEKAIRHFHQLGCRIFNLSVCDMDKPFNPKNPLDVAETLDSLAFELDVLIVVATGNLVLQNISWFLRDGHKYPDYLLRDECKILDPSQAVNVLTVGSLADSHTCTGRNRKPFAKARHPSPFTRSGPGINNYIKPELLDVGGNVVLDTSMSHVVEDAGCTVVTTTNDVGKLIHRTCGTSVAAPRVSHLAARVLRKLADLKDGAGKPFVPSANLLRALLVNSATCGDDWIDVFGNRVKKEKFDWQRVCGYGQANYEKAALVESNRAILIYQGTVEIDHIVYFGIPVPVEMAQVGRRVEKRIRVAVAYDPPVRETRTVQYCGTRMQWRLFRGDVPPDDIFQAMSVDEDSDSDGAAVARPKDLSGKYGVSRRSRSTVQHDIFSWKDHKVTYSGSDYVLAVVARRSWATEAVTQRFAVSVVVETDDPKVNIATPILTEIRQRLTIQNRQRVAVR